VSTAVDTLVEAELDFQRQILPLLDIALHQQRPLLEQLAIGRTLQGQWRSLGSYQNWLDLLYHYFLPRAQMAIQSLSNRSDLPPEARQWVDGYVDAVDIASAAVSAFYQEAAAGRIEHIKAQVAEATGDWVTGSLSQSAIRALRSTSGINCVLVGMRRQGYVDDILAELAVPLEQQPYETAWESLK
jgi:hypothetical protein